MASTISAGTTAGTAIAIAGDTSGVLELRTNGTTTAVTIGTGQNTTFAQTINAPNTFGFKNRIINGAMVIDQRNAGASVTINTPANTYSVDRWYGFGQSTDGVFTLQQNAGSVTPPVGFINYLGATVTTADASIGATQVYRITQAIEGLNCTDLAWGTANAKTVTLSFWVRSSLTGTFGGNIANSGFTRAYPFSYTISSANTWEQKSVTIAGDTTGTWLTTNGAGIQVSFAMGMGSTYTGTANAWNAGLYFAPTGNTNIIATNGATFYITGVQLEVGSTATSFDYRPYGTELALCQRYFQASIRSGTSLMIGAGGVAGGNGSGLDIITPLVVTMRTSPTVSVPTVTNGYFAYTSSGTTTLTNSASGVSSSPTMVALRFDGFSSVAAWSYVESRQNGAGFTASAEL